MVKNPCFIRVSNEEKRVLLVFFWPYYLLSTFLLEMAKNIFSEKFVTKFSAKQQKVLKTRNVVLSVSGIKLHQFVDLCSLLVLLAACKIYIIKQMEKPKLCIAL